MSQPFPQCLRGLLPFYRLVARSPFYFPLNFQGRINYLDGLPLCSLPTSRPRPEGLPALASTTEPSSAMLLVDVLLCVAALTSLAVPIAYVKGQWLASSRGFSLGGRCARKATDAARERCSVAWSGRCSGRVCSRIRPRGATLPAPHVASTDRVEITLCVFMPAAVVLI